MLKNKNNVLAAWLLTAFVGVQGGAQLRATSQNNDHVEARHQRAREMMVEFGPVPMQSFFLPLPEDSIYNTMFKVINSDFLKAPVESFFSVSVSVDTTVIWFDHWEDGYELDITNPNQTTTKIWGDGDASNGCAPTGKACTDESDILIAGQSIVVQNTVDIPRDKTKILYDGRDKLMASFGVTLTRGAYPTGPGPQMAGAVDVVETALWGTKYIAPVGQDIGASVGQSAFEFSAFYYMAAEDNTTVTLPTGATQVLNSGAGRMITVNRGAKLTSDKPIQVVFVGGDKNSTYELRWFSLLDFNNWSNDYVSPVGDSYSETKVILYNANTFDIDVSVTTLNNVTFAKVATTVKVLAGKHAMTNYIPTGSGARIKATSNFFALSITDTAAKTGLDGKDTGGQWYDWGCRVVPTNQLSDQVLIGWGYGCANNKCYGLEERSVVWITPVKDADIYVDYNNTGIVAEYKKFSSVKQFTSMKLVDKGDSDMSGAVIFATQPGSGTSGTPVDIAAAWGQNPDVSLKFQDASLDLGTVVLPFTTVRVTKLADKDVVQPGDILTYTIRVTNAGHNSIDPNMINITDTLDPHVKYVENSAILASGRFGVVEQVYSINDSLSGTPFPFDAAGYKIPYAIKRRGGTVDLQFQVIVDAFDSIKGATSILNAGTMVNGEDPEEEVPFSKELPVQYVPAINITNTVYKGSDADGESCPTAVEYVEDYVGTPIVYCFNFTNTGSTYLGSLVLENQDLKLNIDMDGLQLAPGESFLFPSSSNIQGNLTNLVTVTANPIYENGTDIVDLEDVTAQDPSSIGFIQYTPSIDVTNTVYLGENDGGALCPSAGEYVEDFKGIPIVYCFNVTNTGDSYLSSLVLEDDALTFTTTLTELLAPGESTLVPYASIIPGDLTNMVTVTANPVYEDGTDIEDLEDVTAQDPSSIGFIQYTPSIDVTNTVYLGENDGGALCPAAGEHVEDFKGTPIVYCFNVTNTGDSYLSTLVLDDDALTFTTTLTELLAPGESTLVPYASVIPGNLTNMVTVTANPVYEDGTDIEDLEDVSAEDPSSVSEKPKPGIDPRLGEKDCLQTKYNDAGYPGELDCTSDETIVVSLSSLPSTCIPGTMVNVTINAEIQVQGSKYDVGWYTATDGGDALTGTCSVSGLHKPNEYAVMSSSASGGVVSYCDTEIESSNKCGDVLLYSNITTATVWVPILVDTAVPCLDDNLDGTLDLSVCLTWRTEETDVACFENGDLSSGLYPSTSTGCHCETYEVPTIKVPNVEDVVAPCS